MRALITGSGGFVGKYLREELTANGYSVTGLGRAPGPGTIAADILDPNELRKAVSEAEPDCVFHLAGQANVAKSWEMPQETFQINVIGTLNLLNAVRDYGKNIKVLLVGSSDEYGSLGESGRMVDETTLLDPRTPYAVSKAAQENLGRIYAKTYGLSIYMTRSFNHGGAGQREGYIISDFAAGIARVEKGLAEKLRVGNLASFRDFTHVKDVARAYRLIVEKGLPGEVYNVGSGTAHSAREILDGLLAMAKCPVLVEQDPARLRPSDTPVICCDHRKLTEHTGWRPEYTLEDILRDSLEDWRGKLKKDDTGK